MGHSLQEEKSMSEAEPIVENFSKEMADRVASQENWDRDAKKVSLELIRAVIDAPETALSESIRKLRGDLTKLLSPDKPLTSIWPELERLKRIDVAAVLYVRSLDRCDKGNPVQNGPRWVLLRQQADEMHDKLVAVVKANARRLG